MCKDSLYVCVCVCVCIKVKKKVYLRFLLGSKTLGLNVLELQFVILANHDQNVLVFILDLLKVCLYIKLESSVLQDILCKFAWLDRSRIRLD